MMFLFALSIFYHAREGISGKIWNLPGNQALVLNSHGQINSIVIESIDHNHFTIVKEGWNSEQHIHHCLVHVQIKNDKIWIHFDGTEDSITETLVAAGVPKDKIVLAFHPPHVRKHTEYAIA